MSEQWDELKETIIELRDSNGTATQQEVCKFLANLMNVLEAKMGSTADVVEVVRCKDCKYLSVRNGALGVYRCDMTGDYPSGKHFCAYGERREDD